MRLSQRLLDELNRVMAEDVMTVLDASSTTNKESVIYSPVLSQAGVYFTDVSITADLLIARCEWQCKPHYEVLVRNQLAEHKSQIRRIIAERILVKHVPKLEFNFDEKSIVSQHVEHALQQHDEERKKAAQRIKSLNLRSQESFNAFLQVCPPPCFF